LQFAACSLHCQIFSLCCFTGGHRQRGAGWPWEGKFAVCSLQLAACSLHCEFAVCAVSLQGGNKAGTPKGTPKGKKGTPMGGKGGKARKQIQKLLMPTPESKVTVMCTVFYLSCTCSHTVPSLRLQKSGTKMDETESEVSFCLSSSCFDTVMMLLSFLLQLLCRLKKTCRCGE
jgi:hypothetical protein